MTLKHFTFNLSTGMRFGKPVVFRASRGISFKDLQALVFSYQQPNIKHDAKEIDNLEELFSLKVMHFFVIIIVSFVLKEFILIKF